MKPSRSEFLDVRGLRTHVRCWGDPHAPMLFMLHGWMDVSASFQFVVDCLRDDWQVIAPDWRGFGLTQRAGAGCYWFPDYLADLEALLDHYAGDVPVKLLGHSMGGNIATLYAGIRPQRVERLINLEGFGLARTSPAQAPARYAQWLDELRQPPAMRSYASRDEVASRLRKTNPRLTPARADFLVGHWAAPNARGEWEIRGDPAHKITSAMLYHVEEVTACWERISAPVLWIEADDTDVWRWLGPREQARTEIDRRMRCIPDVRSARVTDAGHMLHHDQPEIVARLVEDFLT